MGTMTGSSGDPRLNLSSQALPSSTLPALNASMLMNAPPKTHVSGSTGVVIAIGETYCGGDPNWQTGMLATVVILRFRHVLLTSHIVPKVLVKL